MIRFVLNIFQPLAQGGFDPNIGWNTESFTRGIWSGKVIDSFAMLRLASTLVVPYAAYRTNHVLTRYWTKKLPPFLEQNIERRLNQYLQDYPMLSSAPAQILLEQGKVVSAGSNSDPDESKEENTILVPAPISEEEHQRMRDEVNFMYRLERMLIFGQRIQSLRRSLVYAVFLTGLFVLLFFKDLQFWYFDSVGATGAGGLSPLPLFSLTGSISFGVTFASVHAIRSVRNWFMEPALSAYGQHTLKHCAEKMGTNFKSVIRHFQQNENKRNPYLASLLTYAELQESLSTDDGSLLAGIWLQPAMMSTFQEDLKKQNRTARYINLLEAHLSEELRKALYLIFVTKTQGSDKVYILYKFLLTENFTRKDLYELQKVTYEAPLLVCFFEAIAGYFQQSLEEKLDPPAFFSYIAEHDYAILEPLALLYVTQKWDLEFMPLFLRKMWERSGTHLNPYSKLRVEPQGFSLPTTHKIEIPDWVSAGDELILINRTFLPYYRKYLQHFVNPQKLFCKTHLIRVRPCKIYDLWEIEEAEVHVCPLCRHGLPYQQEVEKVVGIIGYRWEECYDDEVKIMYIGLWDEDRHQARYAEIQELMIENDDHNYPNGHRNLDWTVVSVLETLNFHIKERVIRGAIPASVQVEDNTHRRWNAYINAYSEKIFDLI